MNILIVGIGSIAKKHIKALKLIDDSYEIVALRSNQNALPEEGLTNVFSIQEAKKFEYEFIIIATPTFLHQKNIDELISFGKPLFIEKPLSNTLKIESLFPLISEKGIFTYVACNLRFLDVINYVKENYINSEIKINEVNSYCGSYLPDWRPNQDFRKNYSSDALKGGGVHLDLIHEIDYLYWFFGKPLETKKYFKKSSTLKIPAYDYANYILEYENFTASVVLNYYRKDSKRTLEIVAETKTILVDLLNNKIYENGELVYQSNQKLNDTYEEQLRFFINQIQSNKKQIFNSVNEAFEVLKMSLA
jgi:predicted dehydrogenase